MFRPSPLFLACALLCSARGVRAETTRYSLFYLAHEGCPTAEQFSAELASRAPWLAEADGEAPLSIEISFEGTSPLTGVLILREADGRTTERTVPGATCAEVVTALALITTVLVDAQRDEEPPAPPPPPVAAAPPPEPRDEPPPRRPPPPRQVRFGFGAGAGVNDGVAPSAALAGTLELSAEWNPTRLFSLLASLSAEAALPSDASSAGGAAEFQWRVLRATACPLRLPLGSALSLRPCALFEGGALEAEGYAIDASASAVEPWWSAGLSARAGLDLYGPLAVALEGGVRYHLRRDTFYFALEDGERTLFAVPAWGGFGRISVQSRW